MDEYLQVLLLWNPRPWIILWFSLCISACEFKMFSTDRVVNLWWFMVTCSVSTYHSFRTLWFSELLMHFSHQMSKTCSLIMNFIFHQCIHYYSDTLSDTWGYEEWGIYSRYLSDYIFRFIICCIAVWFPFYDGIQVAYKLECLRSGKF